MARGKPSAVPAESTLHIEYLPLTQLLRWPGNPKEHAEDAIAASIARFGFRDPLAIDERSGRLIAGHGRLTVLERAHAAGSAPPRFVRVAGDGGWLVPVTRGGHFDSEEEAAAYLVAHNRTGELGGWDDAALQAFLKPLDDDLRAIAGFDLSEVVQHVAGSPGTMPDAPSEFLNDLITPAALAPAPDGQTVSPPADAPPTDEPYLQVVYVVRKSERDQVLEAVKRARAEFGVDTAPAAFMAIIQRYLGQPAGGTP